MERRRAGLGWLFWSMVAIGVDIGLARLGYGLVLPAIRSDIAGGYGAFGLVATVHFAGYLCGTLAGPPVIRRVAAARAAVWAHVAVAVCLAASAASQTGAELGASRMLLGFASGIGILAVVTAAMERAAPLARARTSGRLWSGIAVGLVVSSLATPAMLGAPGGWRIGTLAAALFALVAAAGLARTYGAPVALESVASDAGEIDFRLPELFVPGRYFFLAAGYAAYAAAYTAYSTFIIAALRANAVGPVALAIVWTAFGLAALAGALYVGRVMASRLGTAAFALSLLAGCAGTLVTLIPVSFAAVVGALGVGLGLAATPAIVTTLVRLRCSAATTASAFAAVTVVFGCGQIVGPAVAGVVADRVGPGAVSWLAAAFYFLAVLAALADAGAHARSLAARRALTRVA